MTHLVMSGDDLLAVRFAWSPLWETMHAVRTFGDERAGSYHRPWHRLVADRVAGIDLEPLLAVNPRRGYVPDFLSPPPHTPAPRLADQLAEVRSTPTSQVEYELRRCRDRVGGRPAELLESYLADPAAARDLLADRLDAVWTELVAPFWTRVRTLLERDIEERSRTLARHGLGRMLDELHPRIRWSKPGLLVEDGTSTAVKVGQRGLLLLPSAYLWPAVTAVVDEPWQPTIAYPARGIAELWAAPTYAPEALGRLLGHTRALVLASLERPASTQAVAAELGISASGASGHLIALRDAGLLTTSRHGHQILYRRTRLGLSVLKGRP